MEVQELLDIIAAYGSEGVDISALSEQTGLWRDRLTALITPLVRQGRLLRKSGRPVRYSVPAQQADIPGERIEPFSRIIGGTGSLKFQTQMARAAVAYPPHGIHTLIIGETGVGKSLLASEMGNYLRHIRGKAGDEPFIVLNCAEYSDNPQLLMSELFGYIKGAFTGADRDKDGLVEQARDGILFLDEIHRLPATGQEMLFTVLDRGTYRRLGDTKDRLVRFMLIGATTEKPEDVLLKTFKRRMPLTIQIPRLSERPVNERVDIIRFFFYQEANRLELSIHVSHFALKILISYHGENNIGDLRNEIQLACARGYQDYLQRQSPGKGEDTMYIDIYHLSRRFSVNYLADDWIDQYLSAAGLEDGLQILSDRQPLCHREESSGMAETLFSSGGTAENMQSAKPMVDLVAAYKVTYGSIAPDIWATTNEFIQYAAAELNKTYGKDIIGSVAYYLQQLKAYASAGRIIFSPATFQKAGDFLRERQFIKKMMPLLRNRLNIDIMEGEAVLLAALLAHESVSTIEPDRSLLLIGYGETASITASYANELLNTTFIKAFDINGKAEAETISCRLTDILEQSKNDTIILSALGIFPMLQRMVSQIKGFRCRVIPYLDTTLAVECGRMILTGNDSIDSIAAKLDDACQRYFSLPLFSTDRQVKQNDPLPGEDGGAVRSVIITYCVTGTGSARVAREILLKNFSIASSTDVLPLGIIDNIAVIAHKLGRRLKLIIGVINPGIPGVPFISIEQLLYSNQPDKLLQTIGIMLPDESEAEELEVQSMSLQERLQHCHKHLQYFAPSIDANEADLAARSIIKHIGEMYQFELPSDLVIRLYIHCITMFERISTAAPVPMPLDGYAVMEHHAGIFQALKSILQTACKKLRLEVVDAEIYYLMLTLPNISSEPAY